MNGYGTSFTLYCASPLSRLSEMITFGNFASFRFDMRRSKVAFEIASRASFFVLRRFIVRLLGFRAPSPAQSPHPERPSPPFSVLSFFRFTPRELSSSSISSRIVVSCSQSKTQHNTKQTKNNVGMSEQKHEDETRLQQKGTHLQFREMLLSIICTAVRKHRGDEVVAFIILHLRGAPPSPGARAAVRRRH